MLVDGQVQASQIALLGLKESSVDILIKYTAEIEVMTELRSIHNNNLSGTFRGDYRWHNLAAQANPSAPQ